MKKIPTIFERDFGPESKGRLVTHSQNPECAWVFAGEGMATQKLDGTSCMIKDDALFKRREIKAGKPIPPELIVESVDKTTGKTVGWVPVDFDDPTNQWHMEALDYTPEAPNGTYELIGPKIQGNPEHAEKHQLIGHHDPSLLLPLTERVRTYAAIEDYLTRQDIEGIVWHHPDGRMAKIKKRDFGLNRKP